METLSIKKAYLHESLHKHLALLDSCYGREFCGFFTGRFKNGADEEMDIQNFHWVDNIKPKTSHHVDYQMHPQQMMNVLANTKIMNPTSTLSPIAVHNHPHSRGIPSSIDIGEFQSGRGLNMPYFIFGGGDNIGHLWKWDRTNECFKEIEVEIIKD